MTTATATTKLSIGDIEIEIPVRFSPGHALTDVEAAVLQRAYEKGFKNAAEAAQRQREKYYTVDEYATQWLDYTPGVPRTSESTLEKIRSEAGLRALAELFDEHNADVAGGGKGKLKKFAGKAIKLPAGKGSKEQKEALVDMILNSPVHADRVNRHVDAIKAERGSAKADTKAEVATVTADDLM